MRDEVTSAKYLTNLTLQFFTFATLSWSLGYSYLSKPIYLIIFIYYKITNIRHKTSGIRMIAKCIKRIVFSKLFYFTMVCNLLGVLHLILLIACFGFVFYFPFFVRFITVLIYLLHAYA